MYAKARNCERVSRDLGELKAAWAEYRGRADEATKVVFHGKEFGLYTTGSGEAQKGVLNREMR